MDSLQHLLTIARRGKHRGASGGEKRANRLVKQIVDDVPGIDGMALDGLAELIQLVAAAPMGTREMLVGILDD